MKSAINQSILKNWKGTRSFLKLNLKIEILFLKQVYYLGSGILCYQCACRNGGYISDSEQSEEEPTSGFQRSCKREHP
ncbi:hypothetical protein QQ983_16070, partial [Leptospira borgpetersenii]|uniref:hypothetical protein n=1 Tax=Leptospira borgpetersenii TaxID=174 RepID=UPI000519BFC1|nr:hypothetical protein [Leptospira borgpetersenii]MDQ7245846.1 hypothetical protein [Leptospira borgpetersenii]PTM46458.1 hypothetical protein CLV95_111138 [Leptospira borgpetersenii serovar Javanica]